MMWQARFDRQLQAAGTQAAQVLSLPCNQLWRYKQRDITYGIGHFIPEKVRARQHIRARKSDPAVDAFQALWAEGWV